MTPRWCRALPLAAVVLAVAVGACTHRGDDQAGSRAVAVSRSSTIATGPNATLWLTSPDDDTVVETSTATLEVRRRIAVDGAPAELTRIGDRLLVTGARSTDLTVIDLADAEPSVATVALPCGGSRSVVAVPAGTASMAHDVAVVTCPTDDLVVLVDLRRGTAVAQLPVSGRPSGVVSDGTSLTVSSAVGGVLRTWSLHDLARALGSDPRPTSDGEPRVIRPASEAHRAWTDGDRSPSALGSLDVGSHGPVGVYQVVDNLHTVSPAELAAGHGGYGVPLEGRARIEPALAGACGARFGDPTDPARTLSGPVALAAVPGSDLVWVVGEFSHTVAVVSCSPGPRSGTSAVRAVFRVGDGARGIAVSGDGRTAFVDVGFDHAVARLRLPSSTRPDLLDPSGLVRRPVKVQGLTPVAVEGRRMFNDATDPHLTPSGLVTCASCHPAGGDDGLRWRIQTAQIARKLRKTPPVWGVDPAVKPLHWDGSFTSSDALVTETLHELLGGDGLSVDTSPITEYMRELPAPIAAPQRTARQRAAVARGRAIFESAAVGCASCHRGATGTDGKGHDALAPSPERDGVLASVVTPSLTGTRGRAPYFHDGRSATLRSALAASPASDRSHGRVASLSPDDVADLLAYLRRR